MALPKLTESMIRAGAEPESFRRGRNTIVKARFRTVLFKAPC